MEKYAVRNNRVKNFLYAMGFDYEQVENQSGERVYLFQKSNLLFDALSFYTNFKKKKIEVERLKV